MTGIPLNTLQTLIDSALTNFEAGLLGDAKRDLIRAQRETENIDEKIWKLKSKISAMMAVNSQQ